MKISYNAAAMRASNALNASDSKVSKSLGRLSSGLKVTASKDNPSGYAIGRRMNTQITGIGTATQSSNNGISIIETADGALTEVHEMLQRMNELAVKGETGTLTTTDRMTLEAEVKQLKAEITRISTDTQFNGQTLLDGTFDLRGYTNNHRVKVDYYSDEVMSKTYSINTLSIVYDKDGKIDKDATNIALGSEFPAGVKISETTKSKITLTGPLDFEMTLEIPKDENHTTGIPEVNAIYNIVDDGSGNLNAQLNFAATRDAFICNGVLNVPDTAQITGSTDNGDGTDTVVIEDAASGFRMEVVCKKPDTTGAKDGEIVEVSAGGGAIMDDIEDFELDITGIGSMDIQTGANEGQQLAVRIPTMTLNRMGLEDLTMVSDTSEADSIQACADANKAIKGAILYVSDARSRLGAYQNRLEHTVNNLAVSNENMTASYARIMDVDMAEEMTTYTTEQVISQAAVSMLAQANERPSQVLQLLQ